MRAKHTALILTAGFLLIPTLTWSQGPGGQPDRGFGGGQGGDRGGFNNGQWGGAPWAGQKGGGPGEKGGGPGPMPPGGGQWGGPGGGGGGDPGGGGTRPAMRGDPDQFFNMFSRGKDVIRVDELDPSTKSFFDRIASRFGLTGNEISRDQFKGAMTKVREAMANGQFGPQGGPGGMGQGSMDPDRRAEDSFQRRDKNQNGVLEFDEMPQSLQDERDKYDTNHDGVIDLNEYKAFLAARRGDRGQDGNDPTANPRRRRMDEEPEMEPEQPERKRPQVVRAGNMPKDFPFADLDRDGDGQIGLYEWKDAGRPIAQFLEMDLNNDGFLTVDEYYHWKRRGEELAAKSGNQPNQLARGMGRGMGMNPGMMAFGGGMTGGRGGMMGGGGGNPWAGGGMGMGMGGGNPWGGWGGGRGGFGGGGPGMNFRMGDPSGGGFGDNGGFRGFRGPGGDATATPGGFGGGAQPGMGFPGGGFRGLGGPGNGFGGGGGQDTGTGFGGGPGRNRAPGGFGPPDANTDDRSADRGPGGRGPGGRRGFGGDNSDNGGGRGPGGRRGFGGDNGGDQGPGGFGGRRGGRGPSN